MSRRYAQTKQEPGKQFAKKKNMITEVFHLHVFKKKNLNHIYISSGRLLDAEMVKEIHLLPDKICTAL